MNAIRVLAKYCLWVSKLCMIWHQLKRDVSSLTFNTERTYFMLI